MTVVPSFLHSHSFTFFPIIIIVSRMTYHDSSISSVSLHHFLLQYYHYEENDLLRLLHYTLSLQHFTLRFVMNSRMTTAPPFPHFDSLSLTPSRSPSSSPRVLAASGVARRMVSLRSGWTRDHRRDLHQLQGNLREELRRPLPPQGQVSSPTLITEMFFCFVFNHVTYWRHYSGPVYSEG